MFRCIEGNRGAERGREGTGRTSGDSMAWVWEGVGELLLASMGLMRGSNNGSGEVRWVWRVGQRRSVGEAGALGTGEAGRDLDSIFGFHRCCVYQSLTTAIMIKIVF